METFTGDKSESLFESHPVFVAFEMSSKNPILNNPYEEPVAHYATNLDGELDYESVVPRRRIFAPDIQTVPVRTGSQRDLLEINEAAARYDDLLVNVIRREVKQWRAAA